MRSWIKRHWRWALPVGVVLAAVGAWLVFGFFAFQTYFQDDEVDEALPFFTAGPAPSGMAGDETTAEMADAMNKAMAELDMPMVDEVDEPMPEMEGTAAGLSADGSVEPAQPAGETRPEAVESEAAEPGGSQPEPAGPESTEPEVVEPEVVEPEPAQPEVVEPRIIVEAAGSFIDRSHPTEGSATVLGDGSGQRFLRFEDFRTDNGPDLNVYLSAAPGDAPAGDFDDDFVDLGDLKGNVGAQNYEIPAGLDLDRYSTVAIWCVRFGVVFGTAELIAG
ncbi:MAG: DM13 domain-containing protein [Acidimicrobiaceae bacterium]|nr:DM13 domain-containing protein [Acidimicrobiaceae bacterium]